MNMTVLYLNELTDQLFEVVEESVRRGDADEALRVLGRIRTGIRDHKEVMLTVLGLKQMASGLHPNNPPRQQADGDGTTDRRGTDDTKMDGRG